jgi:hypothetical protein
MPVTSTSNPSAPSRLRWWLLLLTLAALFCSLLAAVFGFLINMDTKIEMNPNGDPLVRQDAIGMRLFAWGGVAVLTLLLGAGVFGCWSAFRRRRSRLALGWSLLAAVPMFVAAAAFLYFAVQDAE